MYGVMERVALACIFALVNISAQLIAKAREVSFVRVMTSFVTGGRVLFTTCGSMILKKVCTLEYPRTFAASYCPREIDSMPPRKISAKYAA